MSEPVAWPECREFYELMQAYRHTPLSDQVATIDAYEAVKKWLRAEIERKDAAIAELWRVLKEARRAIGDHLVPDHCYSTGPLTGDGFRDLVECPACSAIEMFDALIAKYDIPKAES